MMYNEQMAVLGSVSDRCLFKLSNCKMKREQMEALGCCGFYLCCPSVRLLLKSSPSAMHSDSSLEKVLKQYVSRHVH